MALFVWRGIYEGDWVLKVPQRAQWLVWDWAQGIRQKKKGGKKRFFEKAVKESSFQIKLFLFIYLTFYMFCSLLVWKQGPWPDANAIFQVSTPPPRSVVSRWPPSFVGASLVCFAL